MKTYKFNTKFVQDEARNGQECEIIEVTFKAKTDERHDLVNVKFADGYITECYRMELIKK